MNTEKEIAKMFLRRERRYVKIDREHPENCGISDGRFLIKGTFAWDVIKEIPELKLAKGMFQTNNGEFEEGEYPDVESLIKGYREQKLEGMKQLPLIFQPWEEEKNRVYEGQTGYGLLKKEFDCLLEKANRLEAVMTETDGIRHAKTFLAVVSDGQLDSEVVVMAVKFDKEFTDLLKPIPYEKEKEEAKVESPAIPE